jgi:phosphoribosylformimino-5-aminoimidazole carboxamide ribotide isomerase
LPVIDLLHGQVVHAVRGQRGNYRPIRSVLCTTADAYDVAHAFASKLHCSEVYVADLNAIQSGPVQWEALNAIHRAGVRIWLDAGLADSAQVQSLTERLLLLGIHSASIVIGLETWRDPDELQSLVQNVGAARLVFSLDLHAGIPLTASTRWPLDATAIAQRACDAGFQRILLLDLAQVGTGEGPSTAGLCRSLKAKWPYLQLIAGGGVRDAADCQALTDAGCDVVLVATALHSGALVL